MHIVKFVGAAAAVAVSALAAIAAAEAQTPMKQVTLRLDFPAGAEHVGYFSAVSQGYYKEVGLDVSIGPGQGSNVTVQLVGSDRDTFGLVGAATVASSVANRVPVKAIATVIPHTQTGLLVPAGTKVPDAKWMIGKRVAANPQSYTFNELKSVLSRHAIRDADITAVNVSGLLSPALIRQQADGAVVLSYVDGILSKQQGLPTSFVSFATFGVDNPAMTIVASLTTLQSDPALVRAFLKASARGWQFARTNPDRAYKDFAQQNGTVDNDFNKAKMAIVIPAVFPSGAKKWGESQATSWANMIARMEKLGLLAGKVSPGTVTTNDFLP